MLGHQPQFPLWFQEALEGIVARTENAAWHLALVAWLVFAAMILRAALIRQKLERSRSGIPLSVGGWGTRGKSGTERLKAALFQGFRYDVVVKTTGCEAMFIHARRDLPGRELFLYRPYDKATIWEQEKVLTFGSKLRGQVFLWECMALNPHFVEVLNREWMQDEVVTLTNAYPDHEDIMGPAGQDVARVIAKFMPIEGVAYTAEEQMLPVLQDSARQRGSQLHSIDALHADLLPEDLLARFPYEEHPRNIALVLALAEHFGLDRERSLVEMADHVVPDLGVLKTYPTVPHAGRQLAFSNGMSANERAGFLSNWERLGFGTIDPDESPPILTVAVLNNRADRVPRSRVFAEIFARDVVVDRIVCIGTNLSGLRAFLEEAVDKASEGLSLDLDDETRAQEQLHEILKRLRIPQADDALLRRLEILLGAVLTREGVESALQQLEPRLGESPQQLESAVKALVSASEHQIDGGDFPWSKAERDHLLGSVPEQAREIAESIASCRDATQRIRDALSASDPQAVTQLRQLYRKEILRRVWLQEDSDADGNQTLDFVAKTIPPGFFGKLLGCQNIKGTGLDFVYRWISINTVSEALAKLDDEATREEGLNALATHADFGIADVRLAISRLTDLKNHTSVGNDIAPLDVQLKRLLRVEDDVRKKMAAGAKKSTWVKVLNVIEPWLDHLDSIRRSRGAARIMEDLFEQRISQGRAAILLRELVMRQKGGWLAKDLSGWLDRRG